MLVHALTPAPIEPITPWGVMGEHVDEGEFRFSRWWRAHEDSRYSYEQIAGGPERRLVAHVEGLVAGGQAVFDRLLRPCLLPDAADGFYDAHAPRTLAALVAVMQGSEGLGAVLATMPELSPEQGSGVQRAFPLWDAEGAAERIHEILRRAATAELGGWLGVAAERRMVVDRPVLDRALREGAPGTAAAALGAIARGRQLVHRAAVEYRMDDPDEVVRHTALVAALVLGSRVAWPRVLELARSETMPMASELVALLGSPDEQRSIIEWAAEADAPEHALWCMGLTGRVEAAEVAAARLDDERPRMAKLAFEAFVAVTGLPPGDRRFEVRLGPPAEGELRPEELGNDPVDGLPLPQVDEVRAWWVQHRDGLRAGDRHLRGELYDSARVRELLQRGPARRRHALALELAVRSRGACQLATRAWSWRQREAIDAVVGLGVGFDRPYSSLCEG